MCCLLGAFMYAVCSNYLYKLSHIEPTYLASMTLIVGSIMFLPISYYEGGMSFDLSQEVLIRILLLGFLLILGIVFMLLKPKAKPPTPPLQG